jgi:hypothetical protein
MPRGPKGEKRPADVGAAVMVGRIATGEIEEGAGAPPDDGKDPAGGGGSMLADTDDAATKLAG